MKHLIFSAPILYGLGLLLVAGFPTESAKTSLNFSTSSKAEILPDPDVSQDIPEVSNEQAEAILYEMGYETIDGFEVDSRSGFSGSKKVRNFQRDYGLPENGILDNVTRLMIGLPRCGVKRSDKIASEAPKKWSKSTLTYSMANYPLGQPRDKIRELIKKGFHEWSKVTNLNFLEVADSDSADIEITFGGTNHKMRNAKCTFDDTKTLAHAFYPQFGDIHFNTEYYFQQGRNLGEFLDTALHEIGHSLGLDHFNSEASVMHPTASNYYTKPQPIDITV